MFRCSLSSFPATGLWQRQLWTHHGWNKQPDVTGHLSCLCRPSWSPKYPLTKEVKLQAAAEGQGEGLTNVLGLVLLMSFCGLSGSLHWSFPGRSREWSGNNERVSSRWTGIGKYPEDRGTEHLTQVRTNWMEPAGPTDEVPIGLRLWEGHRSTRDERTTRRVKMEIIDEDQRV